MDLIGVTMLIQDKHAVEQRLLLQSAILMSFVAIGGTMMGGYLVAPVPSY